MANLKDIILDMQQALGADSGILSRVIENYAYENGKRTDKKRGYKVEIVCPCNHFEKISVKMENLTAIPITQTEIDEKNACGSFIYVTFEGFAGKLWQDSSRQVRISATADEIVFLEEDE